MIIIDTTLKDNLPFNMKPLQGMCKQVCCSEICNIMEAYQILLHQFLLKLIDDITCLDKDIVII